MNDLPRGIKTFYNLLNKQDYDSIQNDMLQSGWKFGHGSYAPGDRRRKYPFWIRELKDDPYYSEYLLNIIKESTQQDYELYDVYANGHTFGTQGDFHVDWYDDSERTFLFYANEGWTPEYNGKTVFNIGKGDYYYHLPVGNSAIMFNGMIPHMSEGVSRSFTGLRVTIAWKLLIK